MTKSLKLLIVEDNESDAELLLRELRQGGYNPVYERVESAAEFSSALARENWELILSDHSLPRFSSTAALAILEKSGQDIPFIIISGAMGEEAAVAALKSGAVDYLVKGRLARLIPAIERELRDAEVRRERRHTEKALAESERKYRQIIETSMEGIWVIDAQHKTTFVNQQMADMLGTTVECMMGREVRAFMDREAWLVAERNLAHGQAGHSEQYDFRFLKADGSILWAWISTSPIFSEQEQYQGAIAMVTDITKRKRAEELVRESEERFRIMADAAPIMIATVNPQGEVDYVNKAGQKLVAMGAEEFTESRWLPLIHPEDRQKLTSMISEAVQNQVERSLEYRLQDAQSRYRWIYSILSPRFTATNEFAGLITCNLDITERKEAEEALAYSLEKEKLISRIVEFNSQTFNVQDVLDYAARKLGKFLRADRCLVIKYQGNEPEPMTAPRLLGFYKKGPHITDVAERDILHVDFRRLNSEQPSREKQSNDWFCQDAQDPAKVPADLADYFRKYQIQSILFYDISYRGNVYGRISLHDCHEPRQWTPQDREIVESIITHLGDALYQLDLYQKEQTARYHLEESYKLLEVYTRKVEQSNLELENFATIASHDLQSPLRKVVTFGDMLVQAAGDGLNEECRDYLARMKKATVRMQEMITDLLDLSRVNRKGKPFRKTDLREVAQSAMDDLSEVIQARNAEVDLAVDCTLDADQEQLRQVLTNLIENGIKFARPDEPPRVKIRSEVLDDQVCLLHVQDNGIGIKPEYFERIFEVFTRLHSQDTYPGSGIGLSLVKKIVARHQGEVSVSSMPGHGSDFMIRLPLHQD